MINLAKTKQHLHTQPMKYVFTILGIFFGVLGLAASIKDITTPEQSWYVIGQLWFEWAPTSLQVSEAIISRYVDPCGLFISLDCSPFIWHPGISTLLNWYAVPVFFLLAIFFSLIGRYMSKKKKSFKAKSTR